MILIILKRQNFSTPFQLCYSTCPPTLSLIEASEGNATIQPNYNSSHGKVNLVSEKITMKMEAMRLGKIKKSIAFRVSQRFCP